MSPCRSVHGSGLKVKRGILPRRCGCSPWGQEVTHTHTKASGQRSNCQDIRSPSVFKHCQWFSWFLLSFPACKNHRLLLCSPPLLVFLRSTGNTKLQALLDLSWIPFLKSTVSSESQKLIQIHAALLSCRYIVKSVCMSTRTQRRQTNFTRVEGNSKAQVTLEENCKQLRAVIKPLPLVTSTSLLVANHPMFKRASDGLA